MKAAIRLKHLLLCTMVGTVIATSGASQAMTAAEQCRDKEWLLKQESYRKLPQQINWSFILGVDPRTASIDQLDGLISFLSGCNPRLWAPIIQPLTAQKNLLVQKQEQERIAELRRQEQMRVAELQRQEETRRQQEENLRQQETILKQQQEDRIRKEEELQRQRELARIEKERQEGVLRTERLERLKREEEAQAQKDRECRTHCPKQLEEMLANLQSLELDEGSIARFKELRQRHRDLVAGFPIDVKESLKDLDDKFVAALSKKKVEVEREERRLAAVKEAERILPEYYNGQLTLQVCIKYFPEFVNTKSGFEKLIKIPEAYLSAEQLKVIWDNAANKFRETEAAIRVSSDYDIHGLCNHVRDQVVRLITHSPDVVAPTVAPRRKDF